MQQPQMKVDISQTTAVSCEECNHDVFVPAFKMRRMSALLSPTGQEARIPIPMFACEKCGHINKCFLPKEDFGDDSI